MGKNKGHDNLKPAKKGEVRNPKGRPKGSRSRSAIVREVLEAVITKQTQMRLGLYVEPQEVGDSVVDVMTRRIAEEAMKGDARSFVALLDSAYGKVKDNATVQHNFTKMPTVKVVTSEGKAGKSTTTSLSFDVGTPIKTKNDEDDDA